MYKKRWTIVTAASTMLVGALALGYTRPAFAGSPWGADYFPNVPLLTQDGQMVRFYDDLLKGKAVAINLIYTSCQDSCPLETARLAQVQQLLGERVGRDIFFYSISIDPKRDTPAVLKAYMEKFHVGPGWLFLTGKKADIDLLAKKLGLSSLTDAENRDGHMASLMLGNEPTGQWMRNSAVDNPRFLATTISNFLQSWAAQKPGKSYAEAAPLPMPAQGKHLFAGQYLFQTRCAACHTLGQGDRIGPDLLGVTARRDQGWLARFIQRPDQMLAEKDPLATALFAQYKNVQMPNLRLGPGDVEVLLAYLEAQSAALREADPEESVAKLPDGNLAVAHEHHTHEGGPVR
ncbi:MAG TPA: SCO family protein [Candidatus Methylomirabilis sp.]|nr:SCO family protein [Candidatus Methylomirabilis sp.]